MRSAAEPSVTPSRRRGVTAEAVQSQCGGGLRVSTRSITPLRQMI